MNEDVVLRESCYIDPAPACAIDFTRDALESANGGEAISLIVVTCSSTFGVITVVVVGEAVVTIAC
jgi:hypothetical protein